MSSFLLDEWQHAELLADVVELLPVTGGLRRLRDGDQRFSRSSDQSVNQAVLQFMVGVADSGGTTGPDSKSAFDL